MAYMIDVYNGNGVIPWQAVANRGFRLAYLKCSQGATERDASYERNRVGCNSAGVTWGAYHFVTGVSGEAQWENARAFLAASELPPCLDIEESQGFTNAFIWTRAYALLGHLLDCRRIPLIYTNRDMIQSLVKMPWIAKTFALCPLWLADYETPATRDEKQIYGTAELAPWASPMFRQYTEKAEICGVTNVDVSVSCDTGTRWLALTNGGKGLHNIMKGV
jgi:GH25 family lysozyme M1 (1,4-beta-N-acetylmuramidase)